MVAKKKMDSDGMKRLGVREEGEWREEVGNEKRKMLSLCGAWSGEGRDFGFDQRIRSRDKRRLQPAIVDGSWGKLECLVKMVGWADYSQFLTDRIFGEEMNPFNEWHEFVPLPSPNCEKSHSLATAVDDDLGHNFRI
jgi:hypothetical protein